MTNTHTLSEEGKKAIQAALDKATSVKDGVPGVVFAAADREKVLFSGASGVRSLGRSVKMDDETVVWIASCTKAITGIAVMQLVEQGKVELDGEVDAILPEVAGAEILDPVTGLRRKAVNKVTLRMLLSHTAGYSYTFFDEGIRKWAEEKGDDEFGGERAFFDQPLTQEPGTTWRYGVGIDWAGVLVERISGMSLGEYFKANIFDPLGADDIGFNVTESMKPRLAGMHARSPEGVLSNRDHFPIAYKTNAFHSGGGGCFASVKSYLKVLQILINGGVGANGSRILKKETVDLMLSNQVKHLPEELELPIATTRPDLSNPLGNLMPSSKKGWGLTFLIGDDKQASGRSAGSVWWAGLANCYWVADPTAGIVLMTQTQILPFADANVFGVWGEAEAALYHGIGVQ